ncbi:MAG TPA: glycoside hydrolase domain-containing protein [Nocardioidaceae bacterium]|nr:glycoside hydrolase domain-containing protein [Nocardioidaceae bacterium]
MRQPDAMRESAVRLLARLGDRPGLTPVRVGVVAGVVLALLVTLGSTFVLDSSDGHVAPAGHADRILAEPPLEAVTRPHHAGRRALAGLPQQISGDATAHKHRRKHRRGGRHEEPSRDRTRTDPQAGRWRGLAFDACHAPSQHAMDRWRRTSPYRGVGIYIGGALRACRQPHLTRGWVARQLDRGWKLLPLWVGPQASCTGYHRRINSRPGHSRRFPRAHQQGIWQAHGAAAAARALGIPGNSTLFYDIEPFTPRTHRCRASALRFLTAWTRQLHREGYRSGVYSTVGSAISMLSRARHHGPGAYAAPDRVWFAWINGQKAPTMGGYVRSSSWKQHHRAHQYALDIARSYGGVRMHIDSSLVDFGVSASARQARKAKAPCDPRLDRRGFRPLHRGQRGAHVRDVNCLLQVSGHPRRGADHAHRPPAAYDVLTRHAVRSFQRDRHLRPTGRTDRATWTALLASGTRPVLKRGSTGPPVRRVQRALNAALPGAIAVTGRFGPRTVARVRHYQAHIGHRPTGVVAHPTWSALLHGRLHEHRAKHRHHHAHHRQDHRHHHAGHRHRHHHKGHRHHGG